jgi:hypothetical protein
MTIANLITVLPLALHNLLIDGDMNLDATMLQTRGDLEELVSILRSDINNLEDGVGFKSQVERLQEIRSYMMSCSSFMGSEEARDIKRLADYRFEYPTLYATLEVFAWG